MSTPFVYAGAEAPEALQVTIAPETGDPLDLSTVTAVTLRVRDRHSVVTFWDTAITQQTSTVLVVVHAFANDGIDVPTENKLSIMPYLTVAGGTRRCTPFQLNVFTQ